MMERRGTFDTLFLIHGESGKRYPVTYMPLRVIRYHLKSCNEG